MYYISDTNTKRLYSKDYYCNLMARINKQVGLQSSSEWIKIVDKAATLKDRSRSGFIRYHTRKAAEKAIEEAKENDAKVSKKY